MKPQVRPPFEPMVSARTAGILFLCLGLVVLNVYTLWRVIRLERMADRPINVSCRGSTIPADALRGITNVGARAAPEVLPGEMVQMLLSFTMFEKEPGSDVSVLYRSEEDAVWLQAACTETEPLAFEARVPANPADRLRWQAVEKVRGEIIRASQVTHCEVGEIAGDPGVKFSYTKQQGASTIDYHFRQERGVPAITAWQVEEIVLNVTRKGKTEVQSAQFDGDTFSCRVQDTDLELVEVVVRYRDGAERRAEIRPPYSNLPDPLVTR